MNVRTILGRLLEALILAGLAGAVAYGITTLLAPPSISAKLVSAIVAGISAFAWLSPTAILNSEQPEENKWSAPDIYYDTTFGAHKDEGWHD